MLFLHPMCTQGLHSYFADANANLRARIIILGELLYIWAKDLLQDSRGSSQIT